MKKFLKVLKILLAVIAAILIVICCVVEVYPALHDKAGSSETDASMAFWMKGIDDDRLLSDISIPGIHDAASDECQLRLMTKCQDKDITSLLYDGYRYIDARLGYEEINGEKNLTFYHGFLHCLNGVFPWSAHLTFEDVAKQCGVFLKENPSETILFVVKHEQLNTSDAEFEETLHYLIDKSETKDMWLLTDSIPTLGEARGKIVLFRRYPDDANLGAKSGIYIDWTKQDEAPDGDSSLTYAKEEKDTFSLYVQDRYKYDAETKWQVFEKTAALGKQPEDVLINFLSSNGTAAYGHPYALAKPLNRNLKENTPKVLPGWTVVDFGDAELAKLIIDSNK